MKTWREKARPIIADVIARCGVANAKRLRKELCKAYPFGSRTCYPYKAWLIERKAQLSPKPAQRGADDTPLFSYKKEQP